VNALSEVWAMTLLIVLRRNLGERYFPRVMFLNGLLLLCFGPFVGYVLLRAISPCLPDSLLPLIDNSSPWTRVLAAWGMFPHLQFVGLYFVLGLRHRWAIAGRKKTGAQDYSFSIGEPDPAILRHFPGYGRFKTPRALERFFEPAVCAAVGAILMLFANWFGLYLLIGAVCLYHTARRDFREYDQICKDARDGQVTQQHLTDVMKAEPTLKAIPHTVRLGEKEHEHAFPNIKDASTALPPSLRELITPLKKENEDPGTGKEGRDWH
jgi:hypothetical protein